MTSELDKIPLCRQQNKLYLQSELSRLKTNGLILWNEIWLLNQLSGKQSSEVCCETHINDSVFPGYLE